MQVCDHKKLTLAEHTTFDSKADLATKMVFMCSVCGPKVSFMSSAISRLHPENYSANKKLLTLLGPVAYYKLAHFVKEETNRVVVKRSAMSTVTSQDNLMLSYDNSVYNFQRPHELTQQLSKVGIHCSHRFRIKSNVAMYFIFFFRPKIKKGPLPNDRCLSKKSRPPTVTKVTRLCWISNKSLTKTKQNSGCKPNPVLCCLSPCRL